MSRTFRAKSGTAPPLSPMSDETEAVADARVHTEPTLNSSVASATAAFALSKGLRMREIEEASGVSALDLVNPAARLPDDSVARLWLSLAEKCPDGTLSLEMARAAPFTFFGGLAHGAQFAETLRDALEMMVRYRAVVSDRLQVEVALDGDEAAIVCDHPSSVIDGGLNKQCCVALITRLISETLGVEDAVARVDFASAPAGPIAHYQEFFRTEVRFKQPLTTLVLRPDRLDAPVSQRNLELFGYVERHFSSVVRRLENTGYPAALAALHEAVARNAAIGEFGSAQAAARAGLSLRAAQRLAAAHGSSLKQLIQKHRTAAAETFLSDSKLDVGAVASLLGYADDRAFRRAFKRWTGQSPSQFRRSVNLEG